MDSEDVVTEVVDEGVTILLVDDQERNLDVLESMLQSTDYRLVRASSAEAALLLLLDGNFAVIVLDINLPGMNGLELASLIKQRKRTQHIPIIFLTAYFQEDRDILMGYGTGAVDYLTKPIDPQILRSKIGVFADLFRKTRALAQANEALENEVIQRQRAEEALRRANLALEERVQERTTELVRANDELRRSEKALRASEAQAQSALRAKDEFLAALSHELRTPLSPVLLLAGEAAKDPEFPERARAGFELVRKNVELEARLIDDMLDLTRVAHGKIRLEIRPIDAHAVLRDALANVATEFAAKKIALEVDLAAPDAVVWADAVRLQQVFWNVLKNAVKFTGEEARVAVRTRPGQTKGALIVEIADNGIGIAPDELEMIFGVFTQGTHDEGTTSPRKFGGLGLGLAISRTLIELQGGTIRATSPGRDLGATFTLTLRLAALAGKQADGRSPDDRDAGARRRSSAPPALPEGLRLLLVEDHAPTRELLEALLGQRRFDVRAAGSVAEGMALAAAGSFDILVSDVGLPDGDGCQLMSGIRAFHPDLPGVALSGYGMEDDLARARAAGFAEHLTKPVDIESLIAAIASALETVGAASS